MKSANEGPRPLAEIAAPINRPPNSIITPEAVQEAKRQIAIFVRVVFEPDDNVEVRTLPNGRSYWYYARELPDKAELLLRDNVIGQNIYVGVNPRKEKGGKGAADVALCRCLFADFDGIGVEEALRRWHDAGLGVPSLVDNSGHGVHSYLRLEHPIPPDQFTELQKRLIARVNSDKAIHDPSRIMRLPGFLNVKDRDKPVPCEIVEYDEVRRVELADLHQLLPSVKPELASLPSAGPESTASKDVTRGTQGLASEPDRLAAALAASLRIKPTKKENDGSNRLLAVSCRCVEHDLSDASAVSLVRLYSSVYSFPKDYDDDQIVKRIRDAEKKAARGSANSNPASKDGGLPESNWGPPVPASQLGPGDAVEWIWDGYIARGYRTLLTGIWKAGKSTLLGHLLKGIGRGGDVGGAIKQGRALLIAEESSGLWAKRRDQIGLTDSCEFLCLPFKGRPTFVEWRAFIKYVAGLVEDKKYDLVVFDTISILLPVVSENDAAEVNSALMPLHAITEAGAGLLLVHHPRKGDGTEGQASRGSGALPGWVDIILEFRRYDAQNNEDCRRTLKAFSRFDETPNEAVIELRDGQYRLVGSKSDARQGDRLEVLREIIGNNSAGMTAEEVHEAWPESGTVPKPGIRTIRGDFAKGVTAGWFKSSGTGKRDDPLRYFNHSIPASTTSIGAGIESDGELYGDSGFESEGEAA